MASEIGTKRMEAPRSRARHQSMGHLLSMDGERRDTGGGRRDLYTDGSKGNTSCRSRAQNKKCHETRGLDEHHCTGRSGRRAWPVRRPSDLDRIGHDALERKSQEDYKTKRLSDKKAPTASNSSKHKKGPGA